MKEVNTVHDSVYQFIYQNILPQIQSIIFGIYAGTHLQKNTLDFQLMM